MSAEHENLMLWSWGDEAPNRKSKLVTKDVMKMPPPGGVGKDLPFPPSGGIGMNAQAMWSWYPAEGVQDELLFPKGSEVRECRNVNGDWWIGVYMGARGVFPAPFVKRIGDGPRN
jgi:hypothetical protein